MPRREQEALSRLDHRQPLVVDTRELGRRPGSLRRLSRSVPAPVDLGVDVLGVAPGSLLDLDLRLESVMEGVLVTGTAQAQLAGECVRCLDPIASELVVDLQELYAYPDRERDDASELHRLQGDLLDLEPVLRDSVVLALPFRPLCRPDCPGLCPECGARRSDEPCHGHEATDSRFAALAGLTEQPDSSKER